MPKLETLAKLLEGNGYKVARAQDRISISTALLSSVDIYVKERDFVVEPRFGRIKRSSALLLDVTVFGVALILFKDAIKELTEVGIFLAGCVVFGVLWDLYRYRATNKVRDHVLSLIRRNMIHLVAD